MRTTLAIDDDVLAAVRGLAARQGRSLGEVVSDLARQALTAPVEQFAARNGVPLLSSRGSLVTDQLVERLRNELS